MFIKNLSFKFDKKNSSYFFKNLAITFIPHTINFIQGDNGIGKSTLFTILQGTTSDHASLEASLLLDGRAYHAHNNALPTAFTQHVSTVQQQYDRMIAQQFTFQQNLQLANLSHYPSLQKLPAATMTDIVISLGIDMNTPAHMLSGGQRQLLAILMALQKPTRLLLLDEPTATLDKKNAHLVMQCLYQLTQLLKITVLIICHDKELIDTYGKGKSFVMEKTEDGERILFQPH